MKTKHFLFGLAFLAIAVSVFLVPVILFHSNVLNKDSRPSETNPPSMAGSNESQDKTQTLSPDNNYSLNNSDRLSLTEEASVVLYDDIKINELVEKLLPSLVTIEATVVETDIFGQTRRSHSEGSGVIIKKEDDSFLIVTNHHVIANAEEISATLVDGTVVLVNVRGSDSAGDLAVLVMDSSKLTEETLLAISVTPLSEKTEVRVGEMVIALGNALGKGTSATVGYVSATEREITTSSGIPMKLIQTDAAINPGNSGGALINLKGELIGINSSKLSNVSVEGMGFAIPAVSALPIIEELQNMKDVPEGEQGYLGVSISTVTKEMISSYDMPAGVYVNEVLSGGAAERAQLLPGDIITGVNGIAIVNKEQLSARITSYQKGTTVSLTIMRRVLGEYQEHQFSVTLMSKEEMDSITIQ